ncbi:caspase family protein [Streptomyces roseoverticillatus]|uniref:caspase family protein n=1 Tax=Streptomyces roseoverticillatus TaxID=66429 RepID=UPI0033F74D8B
MTPDLEAHGLRSLAILIGVSQYRDREKLPPVIAARNSLNEMKAILEDPALCNWRGEIKIIHNPTSPIELPLQVAELAADTTGVLLIYYVGHGMLSDQGRLCLTVTSTMADRPAITGVPWDHFADALRTSPARLRIAILDCCFAGQAIEALAGESGLTMADVAHIEGVYTLTATTRNRTAHVPPPEQQGNACTSFTGELINLVRTGLPYGPPLLTLGDIYPALRQRLASRGLPLPNQRGTDLATRFVLSHNTWHRPVSAASGWGLPGRPAPEALHGAQHQLTARRPHPVETHSPLMAQDGEPHSRGPGQPRPFGYGLQALLALLTGLTWIWGLLILLFLIGICVTDEETDTTGAIGGTIFMFGIEALLLWPVRRLRRTRTHQRTLINQGQAAFGSSVDSPAGETGQPGPRPLSPRPPRTG